MALIHGDCGFVSDDEFKKIEQQQKQKTFEDDFPSLKDKIFSVPTKVKVGMFPIDNTGTTSNNIREFVCEISDEVFYAVPMSMIRDTCLDKQKVRDVLSKSNIDNDTIQQIFEELGL